MKCVRNPVSDELKRLPDHEARKLARYGWEYVTKGEWKRSVRPDISAMKAAAKAVVANTLTPLRRV